MEAKIWTADASGKELAELCRWLQDVDMLRGWIRLATIKASTPERLPGSALLTVELSVDEIAVVLAFTLKSWLLTRNTATELTVEAAGRSITLNLKNVDETAPILEHILNECGKE